MMSVKQHAARANAKYVFIPFPEPEPDAETVVCELVEPKVPLSYSKIALDYVYEHVIPQKCDVRRTMYCLIRGMEVFGVERDATTIKRADGLQYVDLRRKDGVCDATIRRELSLNSASFGHAVKWERLAKVPSFPELTGGAPRLRWLTPDECTRLRLLPKPKRIQRFILVALNTGVRSRAIETLTWERVDLVNRTIDFRARGVNHKNKRRPIAPINDALLPRLLAMHAARDPNDPYVIGLGPRGRCSCTYQGVKDALEAIGIKEPGVARHVFRHTFCSVRVQAGFSNELIGALVGDTAAMIGKVYGHLAPHHLLPASNMDTSMLRVAA